MNREETRARIDSSGVPVFVKDQEKHPWIWAMGHGFDTWGRIEAKVIYGSFIQSWNYWKPRT